MDEFIDNDNDDFVYEYELFPENNVPNQGKYKYSVKLSVRKGDNLEVIESKKKTLIKHKNTGMLCSLEKKANASKKNNN